MLGDKFHLNEQTIPMVEQIGRHMPGGFFIYKAEGDEELIYANKAVLDIFGCDSLEDFKSLTGYTFRGMLHPDDYDKISESIINQINNSSDNFDYVEYRIVRKDGSIRWVDDYGHYTETETYGGIYYVFISDITEKKEKNIKLMEEVESAAKLADLMGSVASLLSNMPALSFSKEAKTGKYLACNQAFAEYAHKSSPEEVVGLTDYEIFDKDTADHFSADDKKAIEMDEPYIFFEDVPDAGGVEIRNLQTTKMKFRDSTGRLCTLGMCVDVTEMTKIKEAEARRQEMEEKFALQEKILEEERKKAEQDKLITALASDYWSVYYVELDTDEGVCYQSRPDIENSLEEGERFKFSEVFTSYANKYIVDEYRESFLSFIKSEKIKEGLKENRVISYIYMVERNGKETYEMVRFAGVRHPEDRDDHLVHAISACFSDVDAETRRNLADNKTLGDALTAAEQANRAKTAFLSNMSHEIRTPMNAIIGLDNIALSDVDISDRTKEYLEKIGTSAHHLLSIINDILDMSRIESGRMIINNEEFSFSKIMDQVNTIIGGQCHNKGIKYEFSTDEALGDYYIGDDMKLKQIIINVLGNAVKFTPRGGKVVFKVEKTAEFDGNNTITFTISDTGIGMSESYLPRIFDAFSQEDSSATSQYGSTGLGMPITKSLVELMNGNIEVSSKKGVGTTFVVTVTLKESSRKDIESLADDITPNDMEVLVIDDDVVACEHAKLVLGQVGIKCDTAMSGEEGLEMIKLRHARREPYNLILVDWKMPEMDGIETTRQIRDLIGPESAIIILTSFNWDDVIDEAKSAGVDTFVPKPLMASSVMDEFKEAFKKKNQNQTLNEISLEGRRILLAEDVAINAEIISMMLTMHNIQVEHVENGCLALRSFENHPVGYFDAILMDMRMPEMDGLEAARCIRSLDRADADSIPIIALTANAFDEDVQRSLQAGLNAHLSKPVEPDALFDTLKGLLK